MNDFHWKWLVLAAMTLGTVAFTADRCSTASVEVAREKANTKRAMDFGIAVLWRKRHWPMPAAVITSDLRW